MSLFFPTPYPGELIYGLVTRYHIHSGSTVWQDTLQELFPGTSRYPHIDELLPTDTVRQLYSYLAPSGASLRDFVLEHTLMAYEMRFQPVAKKKEYLDATLNNTALQQLFLVYTKKHRKTRTLRYCPLCHREDCEKYGEPYFRVEHQIDILPLCPEHRCRLVDVPRKQTMPISRQLILLPLEPEEPNFEHTKTEMDITDAVDYLFTAPFERSPVLRSENLQTAVENAGLLVPGSVKQRTWDTERLYAALLDKFGDTLTQAVFGEHITKAHALRLSKYEVFSTDEYVLLSVLLGIEPSVLFSRKPLRNDLESRMRKLGETGHMYTKSTAARELGIRVDQMLPYAKRFHIEPFWVQSGKPRPPEERQTYTVSINLSRQELDALDAYMKEHNIDVYGHALRMFMRKALRL